MKHWKRYEVYQGVKKVYVTTGDNPRHYMWTSITKVEFDSIVAYMSRGGGLLSTHRPKNYVPWPEVWSPSETHPEVRK